MGLLSDYADARGGMPGLLGGSPSPSPDLSSVIASILAQGQSPAPGPAAQPPQPPAPGLLPDQAQAQPQAAPAPAFATPFKPLGGLLGFLDQMGGGAAESVRERQYQAQAQAVQMANLRTRAQQIAQSEGPEAAQMFITQPELYNKLHEPTNAAAGSTQFMNGVPMVAPKSEITPAGVPTVFNSSGLHTAPQLPGTKAVNPESGQVVDSNLGLTGQSVPIPQKYAPGETPATFGALNMGGAFGGDPIPGNPPMLGAPSTPPPQIGAPRGIRNNNPGNVTTLPGGRQWAGQTGADPQGYAQFSTPQAGMAAAVQNLGAYQTKHGINTLAGVVQRWAPASAGNNPTAYTAALSQRLGIPPSAPLNLTDPAVAQKVAQGIFAQENGAGPAARLPGQPPQLARPGQPGFSGVTAGQPAGGGYKIIPGAQIPGGDPNLTYRVGPDGKPETIAKSFTMENVQSNRSRFYESPQYKSASDSIAPIQGLFHTVDSVAPGGVVGLASLDTLNKALNPGGVVRPQTVQLFLDHLGLPEEIKSHISGIVGTGPLSPKVIQQIGRTAWQYGKAHIDQASARASEDTALAVRNGYRPEDADEQAPKMLPVPTWAQDPRPIKPSVGRTYWTPQGPMKFTGKGYVAQ